ncbi:MAG: SLBB domain-containing protein [Bacteroidota bacterium]
MWRNRQTINYAVVMSSIFLLSFLINTHVQAQITQLDPARMQEISVTLENARAEIQAKELDEKEVIARMKERGVDLENIDPATADPQQIQAVFNDVVAELEREKLATSAATSDADTSTAISVDTTVQPSVQADEAIEEAIEEAGEAKIYGHQIFRNGSINISRDFSNIKAPDSYRLGAGDQVAISIFGTSNATLKLIIAEDGFMRPVGIRPIYLKGIPLRQARRIITSAFQTRYRFNDDQIEVSLDLARTININVVGEVLRPTDYNLPATNNIVNALAQAGGPTDIGSVRQIELIKGEERLLFDLYKYLLNPAAANAFYLEEGDYINVPVINKVVTIQGAVRRPFQYELLEGENLSQLIDYAAGLQPNAYTSNIRIRRIDAEAEVLEILDVNWRELRAKGEDFVLQSNDVIIIRTIEKTYRNYVEIVGDGAIEFPGEYQLQAGMRISDLVQKARLEEEARTDIVFLARTQPDGTIDYERVDLANVLQNPGSDIDLLLKAEDELRLTRKSDFTDSGFVTIFGAVRKDTANIRLDFDDKLRVSDALLLAGGLKPNANAYAFLTRQNPNNTEERNSRAINVREIADNPGGSDDIILQPFDQIQIFSNQTFTESFNVQVRGAVRSPGGYAYTDNMTLSELIQRSGGLALGAAMNKIEVFRIQFEENEATQTVVAVLEVDENMRVDSDEFLLQPLDIVVVRRIPDFELIQTVKIQGEVQYPGDYALIDDNERIRSIVERAGGLTLEAFGEGVTLYRELDTIGYVVFDFEKAMRDKSSIDNLILKPGDLIQIPKQQDLVAISGATKAVELLPDNYLEDGQIDVVFSEGKRAMYYVRKYAGGTSPNARKGNITVEQANGRVDRTVNFGLFKIYPKVEKGASIAVPYKPQEEKDESDAAEAEPVDWGQIVSNTVSQLTAVFTLIFLIERGTS